MGFLAARFRPLHLDIDTLEVSGIAIQTDAGVSRPTSKDLVVAKLVELTHGAFKFNGNYLFEVKTGAQWPRITYSATNPVSHTVPGAKGVVGFALFARPEFKWHSEDELAKAIAFLTTHEAGHLYGLRHSQDFFNYMIRAGDLADQAETYFPPSSYPNYLQPAFLVDRKFTAEQLRKMRSGLFTLAAWFSGSE
jgi:hypothetical protein